jgi:hypothetical protein
MVESIIRYIISMTNSLVPLLTVAPTWFCATALLGKLKWLFKRVEKLAFVLVVFYLVCVTLVGRGGVLIADETLRDRELRLHWVLFREGAQ